MSRTGWIVLALALVGLPLVAGEFYVNLASQILIAAIFAASLNLLVGYGGLPSLGHASYLGVAAYVSAWLSLKFGLGHWITAPAGARRDDADGGRLRRDRAARHRTWLPDDHARALAGAVGARLPLGIGDRTATTGSRGLTRPAPFGISLDERDGVLLLRADRHRRIASG